MGISTPRWQGPDEIGKNFAKLHMFLNRKSTKRWLSYLDGGELGVKTSMYFLFQDTCFFHSDLIQ